MVLEKTAFSKNWGIFILCFLCLILACFCGLILVNWFTPRCTGIIDNVYENKPEMDSLCWDTTPHRLSSRRRSRCRPGPSATPGSCTSRDPGGSTPGRALTAHKWSRSSRWSRRPTWQRASWCRRAWGRGTSHPLAADSEASAFLYRTFFNCRKKKPLCFLLSQSFRIV